MGNNVRENIPEIIGSIISDCEEILEQQSFQHERISEDRIRVNGFSPQIISQVMRNHLPYTSPFISVILDFDDDGNDTIISLHK